jgi:hypothetical protein
MTTTTPARQPAFPTGARVYMTYGPRTYRAEIVAYEPERDRYEVRYWCPERKTIMQGVCVAPSTLTLAEAQYQPAADVTVDAA